MYETSSDEQSLRRSRMETSEEEVHCELHNLDLSLKRAIESIEGKIETLQRWEIYAL